MSNSAKPLVTCKLNVLKTQFFLSGVDLNKDFIMDHTQNHTL